MLIIGYRTRLAAVLSGLLALAFTIGMVCGVGIHAPLSYSVFAVSAGSFLLAEVGRYPLSLDGWREAIRHPVAGAAGLDHHISLRNRFLNRLPTLDGCRSGRHNARREKGNRFQSRVDASLLVVLCENPSFF